MKRKIALVVVLLYFFGVLFNLVLEVIHPGTPQFEPAFFLAALLPTLLSGAIAFLLFRSIRLGAATFMGWRALITTVLDGVAVVWALAVALVMILGSAAIFLSASDVWEGIAIWREKNLNPINAIVVALVLAPAYGAHALARRVHGEHV